MNSLLSHSLRPRTRSAMLAAVLALFLLSAAGCDSTTRDTLSLDLGAAIDHLWKPMPGDPAALYRLRVASSGGLRMALLTSGDAGRLTVSEPFGSAVSLTAWSGLMEPTFFDLREGCRVEAADLELVLGIGTVPPPQAVLLLAGRLPAAASDRVSIGAGDHLLVEGKGWSARVVVAPDPWRVLSVEEARGRESRWRLKLSDHTLSVPGRVRIDNRDGRWAELELVRLEWNQGGDLPSVPDLRPCVFDPKQ